MPMNRIAILAPLTLLLAACQTVETKTTLTTPASEQARTAGPGDTVMSFQARRPLPNAFGQADVFGRATNAGRTTVRFLGSQGTVAVFERNDILVDNDATTMSQTPLFIPQQQTTNVQGMVGTTPVSATATSNSMQVVGPRRSTQYATAQRPIQITLSSGQSVQVEGRTLRVLSVGPSSVSYVVQ